jgi:hypothetical protein
MGVHEKWGHENKSGRTGALQVRASKWEKKSKF